MFYTILKFIKWFIYLFVGLSIVSVIIILTFNDFKPKAQFLGKKRPPLDRSNPTKIDHLVNPYTKEHPGQTGMYLLEDNLEAFADRVMIIRGAERSVDLQYYIWNNDLTGTMLGYELLKAADRGVFIRILLDDINSVNDNYVLAGLVQHPQIEIRMFNPIYSRRNIVTKTVEMIFRGLSLNRRMHNKAIIADSQIAIIGGRNIGNEYFDADPTTNFFDVDVLLIGNAVKETEEIFEHFWESYASIPAKQVTIMHRDGLEKLRENEVVFADTEKNILEKYITVLKDYFDVNSVIEKKKNFVWSANAHVYSDPPEKSFGENEKEWLISNTLLPALMQSKEKLHMISPYFVPGDMGVDLFKQLRNKNVEIGILTNSLAANDVLMVHSGYAKYRQQLLENGISLFELMPFRVDYELTRKYKVGAKGASLHTKVFMIDDTTGFIGSFNLDPRSARLNTEMGILFDSPEIVEVLTRKHYDTLTQDNSYKLELQDGNIVWLDTSEGREEKWSKEPESGWFTRVFVKVLSWLPIESQL